MKGSVRTALAGTEILSDFIPIPLSNRSDADVNILILQSHGIFETSVDDPWFNASLPFDVAFKNTLNIKGQFFRPTDTVTETSFMGCVEQYEFRNKNTTHTTGLKSLFEISKPETLRLLGLNPQEIAIHQHLSKLLRYTTLQSLWKSLDSSHLLARQFLPNSGGVWNLHLSAGLPSDQWKKEIVPLASNHDCYPATSDH